MQNADLTTFVSIEETTSMIGAAIVQIYTKGSYYYHVNSDLPDDGSAICYFYLFTLNNFIVNYLDTKLVPVSATTELYAILIQRLDSFFASYRPPY